MHRLAQEPAPGFEKKVSTPEGRPLVLNSAGWIDVRVSGVHRLARPRV